VAGTSNALRGAFFRLLGLASAGLAPLGLASPGSAGPLEEVRLGVMAHNTCVPVTTCDNAGKEDGVNINGELVFASPDFLRWARSPRPYAMASVNTAGETSYAGGGLMWTWRFADGWALEPGLGYVIHSNEDLDNPFPPSDPRRGPFQEETLLLGSRDLARLSLSLSRDLTPSWGVQVAIEHLSHGQILGEGRNQGMDEVGVRLLYRLGEAP
jgi:lipid A 3-O-deacylase